MKFVGTVTDISFFKAVNDLWGVPLCERKDMIYDIRYPSDEFFMELVAVEVWQSHRFYSDECEKV